MDKISQLSTIKAPKAVPVESQLLHSQDDKPIRLRDEVMVFDKDGHPFIGTIWTLKKDVLGIETVSCVVMLSEKARPHCSIW